MKIKIVILFLGVSLVWSTLSWAESRNFQVSSITELMTECGPNYCQVKVKSANQTYIKHYDGSDAYLLASALMNDIQRARRITVQYELVGTQNRVSFFVLFFR